MFSELKNMFALTLTDNVWNRFKFIMNNVHCILILKGQFMNRFNSSGQTL